MTDTCTLVCPHCQAVNRVPAQRLGQDPQCGRCHQALFDGRPIVLGDVARFDRFVANDALPLLVDFWAPWCGPCRRMAPAFEQAAGLAGSAIRLAKVDTEAVPELASRYAIRSIPTLALFAGGREIARQAGALRSAADIVGWARGQLAAVR